MKPSPRAVADSLRDMVEHAEKAERFLEGVAFEEFRNREEKVFAAVRALEVIGEAAKNVPEAVRRKHPEIPWRDVAGMRDKITHAYFRVDLRRVFDTVRRDLPPLRRAVAEVLRDLERTESRKTPTRKRAR